MNKPVLTQEHAVKYIVNMLSDIYPDISDSRHATVALTIMHYLDKMGVLKF